MTGTEIVVRNPSPMLAIKHVVEIKYTIGMKVVTINPAITLATNRVVEIKSMTGTKVIATKSCCYINNKARGQNEVCDRHESCREKSYYHLSNKACG